MIEAGFSTYRYKPLDPRWIDVSVNADDVDFERSPGGGRFVPNGEELTLAALGDQLAGSAIGDWTRYRVGGADVLGEQGGMDTLRVVVEKDGSGIVLQCVSRLGEQRLQTQELRSPSLPIIERWLGLRDDGQALDELVGDDWPVGVRVHELIAAGPGPRG